MQRFDDKIGVMSTKVILGMNVFHEEEEKRGEVVEKDTESDDLHSFNPSSLRSKVNT